MAHKSDKTGGYNIQFVKALDPRYKCPICSLALRSPHQTSCGHRFCEGCIKQRITSGPKTCPEDNSPLGFDELFRDAFCNREILELKCYCRYKSFGCPWKDRLRKMEEHLGECLYSEVDCPNAGCDVKIQRQLLQKHISEECLFKKIPCPYCGKEMQHQLMEKHHDDDCPKIKLPCPKGCGLTVPREDMKCHITQECANAESVCPYLFGGCAFQGSRADLKKHLQEKSVDHAYMTKDHMVFLQSQVQQLQGEVSSLVDQNRQLVSQLSNPDDVVAPLEDEMAALRRMLDNLEIT